MNTETIQPTAKVTVLGGAATIHAFGVNHQEPGTHYSLRGIETGNNPNKSRICAALSSVGEKFFRSPSPTTFNSLVVGKDNFIIPQRGVNHHTIGLGKASALYRGPLAEGYGPFESNDAFVVSAADCALIVMKVSNVLYAAHAGRDSLIDRGLINTGKPSKEHPSIVDGLMAPLVEVPRDEFEVFIGFTISKGPHFEHPVDHPEFGADNLRLIEAVAANFPSHEDVKLGDSFWKRGQFDMKGLIMSQFKKWGVTKFETDNVCTFSDKDKNNKHLWFSNRRTPTLRNLFIVTGSDP